jgi:hypothetical protein
VLQARAGDWTQWRGSNRDLIVSGETLLASWPSGGPRQAWQVELPGDGYAEPVVVGGKIYITGNMGDKKNREGHLFALEAKTGKIVWQVKYGPEGPRVSSVHAPRRRWLTDGPMWWAA